MFLAFVFVGLIMVVTALRGNQAQVAAQLEQDFTSKSTGPSFWVWIGAIVILGIIGRVTGATNATRLFIVLLIVVYIVANKGVFANFKNALNVAPPAAVSTTESGAAVDATATPSTGTMWGAQQGSPSGAAGANSNPLAGVASTTGAASSILSSLSNLEGLLA